MMNKTKKFLKIIQLKNKQKACDKLYESECLTDDVLKRQVEINTMRHELDIADSTECDESGYCQ